MMYLYYNIIYIQTQVLFVGIWCIGAAIVSLYNIITCVQNINYYGPYGQSSFIKDLPKSVLCKYQQYDIILYTFIGSKYSDEVKIKILSRETHKFLILIQNNGCSRIMTSEHNALVLYQVYYYNTKYGNTYYYNALAVLAVYNNMIICHAFDTMLQSSLIIYFQQIRYRRMACTVGEGLSVQNLSVQMKCVQIKSVQKYIIIIFCLKKLNSHLNIVLKLLDKNHER